MKRSSWRVTLGWCLWTIYSNLSSCKAMMFFLAQLNDTIKVLEQEMCLRILVSSAKNLIVENITQCRMSLMKSVKSNGLNTEPWETPLRIMARYEDLPFTTTLWSWSARNDDIETILLSFFMSRLWSTLITTSSKWLNYCVDPPCPKIVLVITEKVWPVSIARS